MLTFRSTVLRAIGEAMVELAPVGGESYRRGFAGDVLNTATTLGRAMGSPGDVAFVSRVGTDRISGQFLRMLQDHGLDPRWLGRDPDRVMGLYLIELDGVERHFTYWRGQSAARHLADDADWLNAALAGAGLVYLSGITLAILSDPARETLLAALATARGQGARIAFDPNYRPRLWAGPEQARAAMARMNELCDIVLPSFDDEQRLWGDPSVDATVARYRACGIAEGAVKDGHGPVRLWDRGGMHWHDTPAVPDIRDTAGAGDAFNAGYLAARLLGHPPQASIAPAQRLAALALQQSGALIPPGLIPAIPPARAQPQG